MFIRWLNEKINYTNKMEQKELLQQILKKLEKIKQSYLYSARYYDKMNFRMLIPSVLLTGVCSIASFLSSSTLIDDQLRKDFTVSVAIITSVSTILQTINGSCEFAVKKVKFYEATRKIDELMERLYFEIRQPNEEELLAEIEENLIAIKEECKYIPVEKNFQYF